jgi:hypothetical protein
LFEKEVPGVGAGIGAAEESVTQTPITKTARRRERRTRLEEKMLWKIFFVFAIFEFKPKIKYQKPKPQRKN